MSVENSSPKCSNAEVSAPPAATATASPPATSTLSPSSEPASSPPQRSLSFVHAIKVSKLHEDHHDKIAPLSALSRADRFAAASILQTLAFSGAYAGPEYHAAFQWYMPRISKIDSDSETGEDVGLPTCGVSYDGENGGLRIACCGYKLKLRIFSLLLRVVILVMVWAMGRTLIPTGIFSPGGYVFDPAVVFVLSSVVGGGICRALQIPPLVGVLWVSILWANIPSYNALTSGIVVEFRKVCSSVGLVVILTRAGMALNVPMLKATAKNTVALATIPFALEATLHSLLCHYIFHHEKMGWSILQGVLCTAVAPAVVVPTVLQLQSEGLGTKRGPLPLMLSSVTIDMTLGIWLSNFIADLLIETDINLELLIALGPIQIVAGTVVGLLEGIVIVFVIKHVFTHEALPLPTADGLHHHPAHNNRVNMLSVALMLFCGLATLGTATKLSIPGGGALAVMTCSIAISHLLSAENNSDADGKKKLNTSTSPEVMDGEVGEEKEKDQAPPRTDLPLKKKEIAANFAFLWDVFAMPLLFSMVGTTVSLSQIFSGSFLIRALACILLGLVGRVIMSPPSAFGLEFSLNEYIVLVCGWIGKASVQGALGAMPFLRIVGKFKEDSAEYKSAVIIRDTAVLAILLMAPVSSVLLTVFGRKLLKRD